MLTLLELFLVIAGLAAVGYAYLQLSHRGRLGISLAIILTTMLSLTTHPALAAAVDDNTLSEGQEALQQTLKTTPQENQYQGIEYPQAKGEPLSDREIKRRVKRQIPDGIRLSVSNGSVRLSGRVNNRDAAQNIVQDVKAIPGVHEISYDLGLKG